VGNSIGRGSSISSGSLTTEVVKQPRGGDALVRGKTEACSPQRDRKGERRSKKRGRIVRSSKKTPFEKRKNGTFRLGERKRQRKDAKGVGNDFRVDGGSFLK